QYAHFDDHPVKRVAEHPVSTFGLDVDTGSYANVRRFLNAGRLPPADAVRTEELINYFAYADPAPASREAPFAVTTEVAPSPWNPKTHVLRIGVKTWAPPREQLPPANLVFLVDVSGSMQSADKLPLVKRSLRLLVQHLLPLVKHSLRLLVQHLRKDDRVSLVAYAGASGVVLEPTAGDRKATIEAAIDRLEAGGPTHGAAGIQLAYAKAREGLIAGGINRVLLATDGDFNVGVVGHEALVDLVKRERLADHGDGAYAYIDDLSEARKVLVENLGGALLTVAKDAKVQVEFNPAAVAEYRLIGYENRQLRREDFANDRVDAGDVGAGQSVTAVYELALTGSGGERVEPLRYGRTATAPAGDASEIAFVRVRYKKAGEETSTLLEHPVARASVRDELARASDDLRFAAAVAAFGQQLRGGTYLEGFGYDAIAKLAQGARGEDPEGHRAEFLKLVRLAASLGPAAASGAAREPGV
ncbi:MAG: von Willebrand factor type A domain-containing protein, partial [Gammaproteobacteria bacterium]|nr:von Willebrand factor type A domain-containing protein [Gammaproteobacteria bacterium]